MSRRCEESRPSCVMLLLWLSHRLHKDCTICWFIESFCPLQITCPPPILVSLSYTGQKLQKEMYVRPMRQHFYWLPMANNVYKLVHECFSCSQKESQVTHKPKLQLFKAPGLLQFVYIEIFGRLLRITNWSQHLIIMSGRFLKFPQAMSTAKINWTQSNDIIKQLRHAIWNIFARIDI